MAEELNEPDVQPEVAASPGEREERHAKFVRWLGEQLDERTRERNLLLWLHAEAAWQREQEGKRLRARIHEAVDETQRRYAKYQSRCDDFDTWSKWAREHAERMGDNFWQLTSQVHRLYVMSLQQEIQRLRREVEFEATADAPESDYSNALLTLLDCVHDDNPCQWDHNHSCQTHGFSYIPQGEACPQHIIGEVLKKAREKRKTTVCACAVDGAAFDPERWSVPQCAVHPDVQGGVRNV